MLDERTGEVVSLASFGIVNDAREYVTDNQAEEIAAACQQQLAEDVAPAWNLQALSVTLYPDLEAVPAGACSFVMRLVAQADQPGSLGYHNAFYSEVECAPIIQSGCGVLSNSGAVPDATVSSVASHEFIETIVDPDVNLWVQTGKDDISDAFEACDPVQGNFYTKGLVQVSDFVYPQWFVAGGTEGGKFDHLGVLKSPFQVAPGGYVVQQTSDWTLSQVFGDVEPRRRISRRRTRRLDPSRPRTIRK